MAWLRIGDNASTHPAMSRLLAATKLDQQQKNEAFGVLVQLAAVCAAHLTDGIVEMGLLAQVAPGRERPVLDLLKKAGLAVEEEREGDMPIVRLVLDDEEFVHARRREEVETDRARARDKRTPGLLAQVRVRDGDNCRWCGKSVSWRNRSGYRAATYDSLNQHKDSTVDTLVVSCKSCNSARGAGEELNLLNPPAPTQIIYGKDTVEFVNTDPWCQDNNIRIDLTQPELPLGDESNGASKRQQQESESAAPMTAAATTHRAAPAEPAPAPVTDPEEPAWMTMPLEQLGKQTSPQQRPTPAAAQGDVAAATPNEDRQQQESESAAPMTAAATTRRAAPTTDEAPQAQPSDDSYPDGLERDPGRQGDAARNVGSGRDGSGREGQDRAGMDGRSVSSVDSQKKRRRRGKRGGRKS